MSEGPHAPSRQVIHREINHRADKLAGKTAVGSLLTVGSLSFVLKLSEFLQIERKHKFKLCIDGVCPVVCVATHITQKVHRFSDFSSK